MGSIPNPRELTELTSPSFDEFQRQNLLKKSDAIKLKIQTLEHKTKASLDELEQREVSIRDIFEVAIGKVEKSKEAALKVLKRARSDDEYREVDDDEGSLRNLKSLCLKMDSRGFWRFVTARMKELEALRSQMPLALGDCVDPAKFVLEAISEVIEELQSETMRRPLCSSSLSIALSSSLFVPI